MKRNLLSLSVITAVMTSFALAQLVGTKTINPAGNGPDNFSSFKAAIDTLNTYGVGAGGVRFEIAGGTYSEPSLTVNPATNLPAAARPIAFVVASGGTVTLNVTTNVREYALTIGGDTKSVDYVTLDGSHSGAADRSWTINSVGPDSSQGVLVYGDHVQLKNLVISLDNPWGNAPSRGLVLHETGASDSCLVENCDVTANYAILVGTGGSITQTGNVVRNNTVHCLARGIVANQSADVVIENNTVIGHSTLYPLVTGYGIYAANTVTTAGRVLIQRNAIHELGTNSGTTPAVTISGIYAGSKGGDYFINANDVHNIFNATSNATTNVQVQGIVLQNGDHSSRYVVSNNFVYGLKDDDATENSNWTAGIRPITGGKAYVFHNTVYMDKTTRAHYVAAFICGGGIDATDTNFVFNNIFYSRQTGFSSGKKSYCIYKGSSFLGTLVSDYNLLFNDGGGSYTSIGSPSGTTFAQWQSSGRDVHGSSKVIAFVDTSNDMHLAAASWGDSALAALGLPDVSTDFDDNVRSAVTYMGADEVPVPLHVWNVTSSVVNFGDAGVGDSVAQPIYVKASRRIGLIVKSVTVSSPDFAWACEIPDTVNDSCTVALAFKPHAQGTFSDTVRIVTNGGIATVAVTGTSPFAQLVTSAQSIAFGAIKVDSSAVQTVVIKNNSVNLLVIDSIYTTTPEFLVDQQSGAVLGDSLNLLVAFMPTTVGTFKDTVYLRNNGSVSPIKLPVSGTATSATAVSDRGEGIPHVFSLKQNYPNPFNPSTKLEFTVPSAGRTTLRVYNTIGQLVVTLFDGAAETGRIYQQPFNATSLPTGMYLVRLQFNDQVATQKMLLVK